MRPDYAQQYSVYEANHWWFRARRIILKALLEQHVPWNDGMEVLEVGTGPGANLSALYPATASVVGREPDDRNAGIASRSSGRQVFHGSLEKLPPPLAGKRFDVITLFDVLEHIERDTDTLALLRTMLKPGGRLVLTVPAYQWLWGQQDAANLHFRRYTRRELAEKVRLNGFTIRHATYFNTFLFPPIAAFRLLFKLLPGRKDQHSDFEYSAGPLDQFLFRVFAAEMPFLRRVRFPFGLSLFMAAAAPAP